MPESLSRTISPVDGRLLVERPLATDVDINHALSAAAKAQRQWALFTLQQRADICLRAVSYFEQHRDAIAEEISWQMGRPIQYCAGEVNGLSERARHMIDTASAALADIVPAEIAGFKRYIRRQPLGIVLTVAPWNYPLLTTVNSLVPALMAGNAVLLKPSAQTPLSAERFINAFEQAGLPAGLLQNLFLSHDATSRLLASGRVDFCCFTGSVAAGRRIESASAGTFTGLALELGGKDPAYVRSDADLSSAVANLVDGAFFNSGQSCCGIERIYVDKTIYPAFVDAYVELTRAYVLGNPLQRETTLGPLVRTSAADWVRQQTREAIAAGATALLKASDFSADEEGSPYLAPQILVDVDHTMSVMREESFGPVVGIMPVDNDQQALELMNDSDLGLTASIWTTDSERAEQLGQQLETGTVFMNRCDYLDPALVWTGVKDTGRGASLSVLGYQQLTRAKSFHLKLQPS